MATKAAGKGHDSWIRFPGLSMVLQGLVVELVCSPGYHVYLAASGVYHSEWAATEAGKTATLRTVIICATLTYFARAFTRVRTKWLLDAVWFVTPAAAAIAAWGQGAAFPVATWLVLRQAWMILASSLKSSGHTAPLTLTDSAKRLALPPSRILIAADAVPPKLDGVAVFVTHGCRELGAMGHTVHLFTSIPGPKVVEGAEVSRCFGVRPAVYPEHSLSFPEPWRLFQVFFAFKPHVVHIFDASIGMASITSIFCWLFDVPCIVSHHTRIDLYAPFFISILPPWLAHIVMWGFRRVLTGYSPANLAVCMPLADQLVEQFSCRPHRVHMWHSGTDVKSFRPQLRDSAVRRTLHSLPAVGETVKRKADLDAGAEATADAQVETGADEQRPDGPSTPASLFQSSDGFAPPSSPSSPSVRPMPGRGSIVGEAALHLDATSPLGEGDGLPIVLYVGRLAAEKNTYVLPEVARGLSTANGGKPLARLVVVGKGPSMEDLKRDLAGTGAVMLGARYGDELKRIYASSDVFLTTCTTEAFCLVGLEAMASGLPVIAPAAGGVLELFDDGNQGYFYKPESGADAVAKVKMALLKDHAAAPMCGMRLRARELVEAQSWTTTYEQAAQHYMDVIQAL